MFWKKKKEEINWPVWNNIDEAAQDLFNRIESHPYLTRSLEQIKKDLESITKSNVELDSEYLISCFISNLADGEERFQQWIEYEKKSLEN